MVRDKKKIKTRLGKILCLSIVYNQCLFKNCDMFGIYLTFDSNTNTGFFLARDVCPIFKIAQFA